MASTLRSIRGRGNLSFGQALLIYVKSMQSRHLPFAFLTRTTLANHSGYSTSLIAFSWRSFPTSSLIAFYLSGVKFLLFCLIGLKDGLTFSLWVITTWSIPPLSSCFHANTSMFCFRKWMRGLLMSSTNLVRGLRRHGVLADHQAVQALVLLRAQVGCLPRPTCRARPHRFCRPFFASLKLSNTPWLCAGFLEPFLLHL